MILVTGGLGFVGAHTSQAVLEVGMGCVAARHRRSEAPLPTLKESESFAIEPLDVTDWEQWVAVGRRRRVTGIIHLAAAPIDESAPEQLSANLTGLLNTVRAASAWGVERVVVASSIGVYAGVRSSGAFAEDLALPPIGLHGIQASKKILEIGGDLLSRSSDVQILSARLPAVWGPLGHPASRFFALPGLVHAAVSGQRAQAVESAAIDAMYVRDVARALVALLTADKLHHHIYNVGSGHATSNADVARAIAHRIPDADLELEQGDSAAPVELDVRRLHADTGFQPRYDLSSGVGEYIDWLRSGHAR